MTIAIDHSSYLPIHAQVEQLLRKMIELPQYLRGEYLAGEVDLAGRLGIKRNTIRQATNKIEIEGLISRKKGKGTKVIPKTVSPRLDNWHSFTQEMNDKGVAFINYLIKSELVEADDKITSFFNIAAKTPVIKLSRLREDSKGPFVYFESYFHPSLSVSIREDFSQPLYELLETTYNTPVAFSREKISACKSTSQIAKPLRIPNEDTVMIKERFVSHPDDRPVENNIGHYNAEKFSHTIEIRR